MPATPGTTPASVVTAAGLAAAAIAGVTGPKFNVIKMRIGNLSMADGIIPADTDTDVDGFVYEADISHLRYSVVNDSQVNFTCLLGLEVGPFNIGNFGIFLDDGTMLAKVALPQAVPKTASAPPAVLGDYRTLVISLILSNDANAINFSILETTDCTIAEVADETYLPSAGSAIYNVFLCRNNTLLGVPTLAARNNGSWWYTACRDVPGEGQGVISTQPSNFLVTTGIGKAVSLNPGTHHYDPYDGSRPPIGMRKNNFQIVVIGPWVLGTSVTANALYYIAADGTLSTTSSGGLAVGWGLNATQVWLDFTGQQGGKWSNELAAVLAAAGITYSGNTAGQLTAAIQALSVTTFPVGFRGATTLPTAPDGWVLASGRTIGSAASNATERANADTRALFNAYWAGRADLQLYTSTGSPVARGVSADVDWALNRAITIPDYQDRAGIGRGDMSGTPANRITVAGGNFDTTVLGASQDRQNITIAETNLPANTAKVTGGSGSGGGSGVAAVSPIGTGASIATIGPVITENVIIKL